VEWFKAKLKREMIGVRGFVGKELQLRLRDEREGRE